MKTKRGRFIIGENIKNLREENNYSQTALAKRLGISRSAVNAWEMGISIPSTQYVVELAKIFKVSADYILDIEKSETINIGFLKKEEKEIINTLLNYFRKYRFAVDFMNQCGLALSPDEEEPAANQELIRRIQKYLKDTNQNPPD